MRSLITLVILFVVASVALPQSPSGGSGNTQQSGEVRVETGYERVEPGDCHTNNDGVEVCNTGDTGDGDFTVDPANGSSSSSTTVEAKNDAEGTVENIDDNDTVNCANGSDVEISGTGGTVNANSGSSGSVTNTNTPGGGGGSITINVGGGTVTVPPGGTVNFTG